MSGIMLGNFTLDITKHFELVSKNKIAMVLGTLLFVITLPKDFTPCPLSMVLKYNQ